jgi:hypothetical protein
MSPPSFCTNPNVALSSAQLIAVLAMASSAPLQALDSKGALTLETRAFTALHQQQNSLQFTPEWAWNQDNQGAVVELMARADDQDARRNNLDIRKAYAYLASDHWEIRLGIDRVFWGVTESHHLVDIINQTDLLGGFEGEDKLGQPMLRVSRIFEDGELELFYLPYFRAKKYPDEHSPLAFPLPTAKTDSYQARSGNRHTDFAIRYSHSSGPFDGGLHYFKGTSRQGFLLPSSNTAQPLQLQPYYDQIEQAGLDLQATLGSWLLKSEILHRNDAFESFNATSTGIEYTAYGLIKNADLGLILERNYDQRNNNSQIFNQNDVFIGCRLAINDAASSELLVGLSKDQDHSGTQVAKVEATRRMGASSKISLEAWQLASNSPNNAVYFFRDKDFIQLALSYYY